VVTYAFEGFGTKSIPEWLPSGYPAGPPTVIENVPIHGEFSYDNDPASHPGRPFDYFHYLEFTATVGMDQLSGSFGERSIIFVDQPVGSEGGDTLYVRGDGAPYGSYENEFYELSIGLVVNDPTATALIDDSLPSNLCGFTGIDGFFEVEAWLDENHKAYEFNGTIQLLDLGAKGITYVPGPTVADDKVHITYDVGTLLQSRDFNLRLYWSTDTCSEGDTGPRQCYEERYRQSLAYEDVNPPRNGIIDLSAAAIAATRPLKDGEPDPKYTHLLLHVDDGSSTDEGDIRNEDDDPSNNYAALDIAPDIIVGVLKWGDSDVGGLDINYEVKNRAFVDKPIEANLFWQPSPVRLGGGSAAAGELTLDRSKKIHHVAHSGFVPPLEDTKGLVVRVDLDNAIIERDDDNGETILLELITPIVQVKTPAVGYRKQQYGVEVLVRNNAPIPINVIVAWSEVPSGNALISPTPDFLIGDTTVHLPFMKSDADPLSIPLGQLKRTWDWIPPNNSYTNVWKSFSAGLNQNGVAETLDAILGKVKALPAGAVLSLVNDIRDIHTIINPKPKIDEVTMTYTATAKAVAGVGATANSEEALRLAVPDKNKDALKHFQLAAVNSVLSSSLGVSAVFAAGASAASGNLPAAAIFGAYSLIALADALSDIRIAGRWYIAAVDPPDPNYSAIATPQSSITLPSAQHPAALLRSYADGRSQVLGLEEAMAVTEDRILGAIEAEDVLWEAEQRIALSEFASQASIIGALVIGGSQLQQSIVDTLFAYSQDARAAAVVSGIPGEVNDALVSMSASVDELELFRSAYLDASPSVVALPAVFTDAFSLRMLLLSRAAVTELTAGVSLRVEQLGADVRALTSDEEALMRDLQSEIEIGLGSPLPSKALRDHIVSYLEYVRYLVLQSNNATALTGALEFGYGALFLLQEADVRPSALRNAAENLRTDGEMSDDAASSLLVYISEMDRLLTQGDFAGYLAQLFAFGDAINQLRGAGLSQSAANLLSGYVAFVTHVAVDQDASLDFGDAPDPLAGISGSYPTLLANNGARHELGSTLFLGASVDAETDGQPHASALGDDSDATGDDEDGVGLPTSIIAGLSASATVTSSGAGLLDAWIDFNKNGVFDPSEQIAASLLVAAGQNTVSFDVPASAAGGTTFARFRLSSAGGLGPDGLAGDGEVEDYQVQIQAFVPGIAILVDDPANPGQSVLLVVGTANNDQLVIEPRGRTELQVKNTGRLLGIFPIADVDRIVAFGLNGNDVIIVNPNLKIPAELHGNEGNDHLRGGGGHDLLFGDEGDDSLFGANGDDALRGAAGDDSLFGGKGNDNLDGEDGNDVLKGDAGLDILLGNLGNDLIFGGQGRDLLIGGIGRDRLFGQEGDDTLVGGTTAHDGNALALQAIFAGRSGDSLTLRITALEAFLNADTVFDDAARDELDGGGGRDWFLDFALADAIKGFNTNRTKGDRKN